MKIKINDDVREILLEDLLKELKGNATNPVTQEILEYYKRPRDIIPIKKEVIQSELLSAFLK